MRYGDFTIKQLVEKYQELREQDICGRECNECLIKPLCDNINLSALAPIVDKDIVPKEKQIIKRLKMCGLDLLLEEYKLEDILKCMGIMTGKTIEVTKKE